MKHTKDSHSESTTKSNSRGIASASSNMPIIVLLLLHHAIKTESLASNPQPKNQQPKTSSILRKFRSNIPSSFPFSLPWYEQGLDFSCTGCGKCCRVDGDVWLSPEEIPQIMQVLEDNCDSKDDSLSLKKFREKYVKAEIFAQTNNGSEVEALTSETWMCLKREEGACVFLDPSSNKCGIYDVRPVQCRTYPFWPSLLESPEDWFGEAVLPDDVEITETINEEGGSLGRMRYWSPELGGCEGIGTGGSNGKNNRDIGRDNGEYDIDSQMTQEQVEIVAREEIVEKMKEAKRHWKRFPIKEIKESSWYL
mmetsp:Transcript_29994/g.62141  ORF Transcript_29994/g.62141 Transcript_29994/m.62141 type:complete len:308 (-) Transcript_29994:50-973(-)